MALDPTDPAPATRAQAVRDPVLPGTQIGRYEIIDLIGSGGMGEVYRARDVDLGRPAAIKVVRGDLVGRPADALLREAQAMAKVSHPNIVVIYEVGTIHGEVFLAMEYVEGVTERAWLGERKRGWREVVAVFVAAGRGLAAAHRAGIVHRDFKPDNVLIGNDGRVRVADFGLAAAVVETPAPAAGSPDAFRSSTALSGTLAYMSPEQFLHEPPDARSDQFAFAVALYEALFGRRPFPEDDPAALRRSVVDGAAVPPPRDSAVPAWVQRIVLRAMARDREDRFGSMDDVVAALELDPAVRRRRWMVTAALTGTVGLAVWALFRPTAAPSCGGGASRLAGVWDEDLKARVNRSFAATGRAYAADSYARVSEGLDSYSAAWLAMRTEACEATAVRHEQSPALLDLRMECLDRRRSALGALVTLFAGPIDDAVLARAAFAVHGLDDLRPCADRAALTAELPLPSDPAVRVRVAALRQRVDEVHALNLAGRYQQALALATPLANEVRALPYPPLQVEALRWLANVQSNLRDAGETATRREILGVAARAHDDLQIAREWAILVAGGKGPAEIATLQLAAESALARAGDPPDARGTFLLSLATALQRQGDLSGAARAAEQAIAILESTKSTLGEQALSSAVNLLGSLRRQQGKYAEARAQFDRALALNARILGPNHPYVGGVLINLGNVQKLQGDYAGARDSYGRALVLWEGAQGPDGADVATVARNLGDLELQRARPVDALAWCERSLAIRTKRFGPEHPSVASSLTCAGSALFALGRVDDAADRHSRALAIREKARGPDHPDVAESLVRLSAVAVARSHPADALADADRAIAIDDKAGAHGVDLAEAYEARADALAALGKVAQAKADDERALTIRREVAPDTLELASTLTDSADRDVALGHPSDALAELRNALDLERAHPGAGDREARTRFVMARALWANADHAGAVDVANEALREYAAMGAGGARSGDEVARWLSAHGGHARKP